MGPYVRKLALVSLLVVVNASAQKIKVVVDQDARGPGTSDQQAILVFLQSKKFDVLGITTVSGDQWVKEETQHVLRLLEISGRTDVPVRAPNFRCSTPRKRVSAGKRFTASSNTKGVGRSTSQPIAPRFMTSLITRPMLSLP